MPRYFGAFSAFYGLPWSLPASCRLFGTEEYPDHSIAASFRGTLTGGCACVSYTDTRSDVRPMTS